MSNERPNPSSAAHERLVTVVGAYRVLLQADERRLHEAMQAYESSCWKERLRSAA